MVHEGIDAEEAGARMGERQEDYTMRSTHPSAVCNNGAATMPARFLADLPGVQLAALPPARLALLSLGSIEYLARC